MPKHFDSQALLVDDMPPEVTDERQGVGGANSLDTLAVLRASQALSSERNTARLKARVEEVLGSVAGATKVVLALWNDDAKDWLLQAEDSKTEAISVDAAPHRVSPSVL